MFTVFILDNANLSKMVLNIYNNEIDYEGCLWSQKKISNRK